MLNMNSSNLLAKEFSILFKSAIDSINPGKLIRNKLVIEKNNDSDYLHISNEYLFPNQTIKNDKFKLNKNVYVAAFGKAALSMTLEIENLIGDSHLVKGIAILPFNDAKKYLIDSKMNQYNELCQIFPSSSNSKIEYYYGAKNNFPDINSFSATKKIIELCDKLTEEDILLTLISGGGSALLTCPAQLNQNFSNEINLKFKLQTIKELVNAGANINELNTVRSCLSNVKGGKLAQKASKSQVISIVISDVIDDPLEIIASGPTCISLLRSNKVQSSKSLEILEKYNIVDRVPIEITDYLRKLKLENNEDENIINFNVNNYLIGNNKSATKAILESSTENKFNYDLKTILANDISGEARLVGLSYAFLAYILLVHDLNKDNTKNIINFIQEEIHDPNLNLSQFVSKKDILFSQDLIKRLLIETIKDKILPNFDKKHFKICLISGGETTVNFNNSTYENSLGGRNQEMTIAFELTFRKIFQNKLKSQRQSNFDLLFSSFGSDGIDGPTDAAGGYFLFNSNESTDQNFQEIVNHLNDHNSYNYLKKYNRLIEIGSTGTNVSDLQVLLINSF